MSEPTVAEATDRIYESLQADNVDIDLHIAALKAALERAGLKEAVFDPAKLVQCRFFGNDRLVACHIGEAGKELLRPDRRLVLELGNQ